jgi:hypothetical protein
MNIGEDRIQKVFEKLRLGKIKHVDFVLKPNGKSSAYVHLEQWYDNVASVNFQERVRNPEKEARIVYDEPWYWVVLENTSQKRLPRQRKMYIDVSGLNTPSSSKPVVIPDTPIKKTDFKDRIPISCSYDYESWKIKNNGTIKNLNSDFDIEAVFKKDDNDMISIDGRYIKTVEDENASLRKALQSKTDEMLSLKNDYKHRENMLNDDIACLKLKVSLLEDQLANNLV